jgi:ribosomal protein S18 acetylase RimI-like enzyme
MEREHRLYRLRKEDLPRASSVLGHAFEHDPDLAVIIRPDREGRRKKILSLFKCFVKLALLNGEAYAPSSGIEGVSMWFHSSKIRTTFIASLRAGFLSLLKTLHREELSKLQTYGQEIETYHHELISEEHWYLNVIGVDPDHRRKGHARSMLEGMLSRIDEEGLPCFLDTNSEENIAIYEKFGFAVAKRYTILEHSTHWGMIRHSR